MKYIRSLLICCLAILTFSPNVFAEATEEQVASCKQEAADMGLQEGEEYDSFLADCLKGMESTMSSEEQSMEETVE